MEARYADAAGTIVDAATGPNVGPPSGNIAGQIKVDPRQPDGQLEQQQFYQCCLRGRGFGRESHKFHPLVY